jgi:hypothetical protein
MLIRHWLRTGVCLGLIGLSAAFGLAGDQSKSDPPVKEEPLSSSQETISKRYKRFEETLSKIHEVMRKTDPDRAELLLRAIGRSKEDRIATQMNDLVQLLRDNRQLGDAIERQKEVVTQLHALLDLLLSEDRQKELKEEQARIKKYLEELNKIIAREKGNRADNERGAPADEVADQQKKIIEQTKNLGKAIDKDDKAKQARSRRSDADKSKEKPKGEEGKPGDGDAKEGDPKEGKPGEAESKEAKPGSGDSKESEPADKGKPGEGKPGEGKPKKGEPQEGQPGEGQPGDGESDDKKSPEQPTPGREELEKAKRAMEQAIDKLKKQQRHEASDEQDEAISNLQKAKEKLEEILRQLREEERERFLAMLEARFQRMLAMQLMVYDGTQKLGKTPEAERSSRHQTRALQLAREEDAIALEASKAIQLLRDEGSAVAFPEAVEQVRDDMRIVEGRLERADAGELTQGIERDIIDSLEELIEALQKEMEKSKEKKEPPPSKESGPPQDPPLVDQLAELKMLRTLQLRINHRTKRLGQMIDGEQASDADVIGQLQNLADRQSRIQRATHDLATGKNK